MTATQKITSPNDALLHAFDGIQAATVSDAMFRSG